MDSKNLQPGQLYEVCKSEDRYWFCPLGRHEFDTYDDRGETTYIPSGSIIVYVGKYDCTDCPANTADYPRQGRLFLSTVGLLVNCECVFLMEIK